MTVFYYTLEFVNKNTKSDFFETSFADVSCETVNVTKSIFSFAYQYRVPYDNGYGKRMISKLLYVIKI